MRQDRGVKVLLALIAAGLWGLMLLEAGLPTLMSPAVAAEPAAVAAGGAPTVAAESPSVAAEPHLQAARNPGSGATMPLRWKVSWATQRTTDTTYCGTAIVLNNDTGNTVDVEVEWYNFEGGVVSYRTGSTLAWKQTIWITGDAIGTGDVDYRPFYYTNAANLSDFLGYARVFADDPRIEVSAFQYCRDGLDQTKNIMAITNIPAHAVGPTIDFYVAGTPDAGMSPTARPGWEAVSR